MACPRARATGQGQGHRVGLRAAGLDSRPQFSSWGDQDLKVTVKCSSGRLQTSLVTVTEEGLSQLVEEWGEGHAGSGRWGTLYWPSSTPLPVVSRRYYPKLLLTTACLRDWHLQGLLEAEPITGAEPGEGLVKLSL